MLALPLGGLAAAGPALWLAAGGWVDEELIRLWAAAIMVRDVPGFAAERLPLVYPQLWFHLLVLLEGIGRSPMLAVLPLLAAVVGGLVLVGWYERLRAGGWSFHAALAAVASALVHPFAFWAFSRAGPDVLALGVFASAAAMLRAFAAAYAVRRLVLLALLLVPWMLLDPRFVYYGPALLPLLALLSPAPMLREGPFGLHLVLLLPLLGLLALLVWLGWAAAGDPLAVLAAIEAGAGGSGAASAGPWLERFGGRLLEPMLVGAALLVAISSAALPALLRADGARRVQILLAGLLLAPVAGLAAATALGRVDHPLAFLFLAIVPTMLALSELATVRARRAALALLLLGGAGGWWWVAQSEDPRIARWRAALLHHPSSEPHAGERALAAFLARGPATLLDDRLGAPVIAALGRADRLVLPPDPRFLEQTLTRRPSVRRIAVPDPSRPDAARDRILQAFPELWSRGPPGGSWRLVYDRGGWRVWCREQAGSSGRSEPLARPADGALAGPRSASSCS